MANELSTAPAPDKRRHIRLLSEILRQETEELFNLEAADLSTFQDNQEALADLRQRASEERIDSAALLRGAAQTSRILPGRMYFFRYDPIGKRELPYYDRYPLIFTLARTQSELIKYNKNNQRYFTGINLHYLPPVIRAELMDYFSSYIMGINDMNVATKIRFTKQMMMRYDAASARACIKRYRFNHLRSKFVYISPEDWNIFMMLPIARFFKSGINTIWNDTRQGIRKHRGNSR